MEAIRQQRIYHEILAPGLNFEVAAERVRRFFARYQLVRYDDIAILRHRSMRADEPGFWARIEEAESANKHILDELIRPLEQEGFRSLAALRSLSPGYQSKMLHTIAHLLDGFFGVDSFFYHLEADSHWLTPAMRQEIEAAPANHWLLAVEASFVGAGADLPGLVRLMP